MPKNRIKLPINAIDIVRHRTWTGLTVAELFHAGRLGSNGADRENIIRMTHHIYQAKDLEELHALIDLAHEAHAYLLSE